MAAPRPKLHHIALTVTDLDASVEWYEKAFGISFTADIPHEGGLGRLLTDEERQLSIVLHRHDGNEGQGFHETHTGLDHVGLAVDTRAELEAWERHLEELGVKRADPADRPFTRSAIIDEPYGSVLVFRDPDNIQLELFAPAGVGASPRP